MTWDEKTIEWVFFNVVIPMIPVAIVWFLSWFIKTSQTIFSIIKDGQIFFYCTALTAVAIGDLQKCPKEFNTRPWMMGLVTIIILSSGAFAAGAISKNSLVEKRFGWASVAMAIASILTVISFRGKAGLL
jgi:hypothetical protein